MYTPITEEKEALFDTPENAEHLDETVLAISHAAWEEVSDEIVQQTIDAEEKQETIDTRVLRDFDEGIITFGRDGVIRYINPAASMILGLTDNAVGKRYQELFGAENEAL